MTTVLGRYVARTVIASTLLVLVVLTALKTVFSITSEIASTGQGDYGLVEAILYVLLTTPASIYKLFPAAVAIGGVVGLGALAGRSELVVMRAAGLSIGRIVAMVMQGGLVLVVGIVLLGEFVAPPAQHYAELMRARAIAGQAEMVGGGGFWLRDRHRFIHIDEILPGHVLKDIRVYEFEEGRLRQVVHIDRASYQRGKNQWRLQGVQSTRLFERRLAVRRVERASWQRLVPPDLFDVLSVSPDTLSAWRLFSYVQYLRANDMESARFALAFWRKIATPLSTLVMLLLALPVVFGSVRTAGTGQRVFVGSVIGVGYLLAVELFSYIGIVYGLAPPVAVLTPVLLFAIAGVVLLRRTG